MKRIPLSVATTTSARAFARAASVAISLVIAGSMSPLQAEPVDDVAALKEEIVRLREESAARIRALEERLAAVESQRATSAGQASVPAAPAAAAAPGDRLALVKGDNRFIVTGWGAAGFGWESAGDESTFEATVAPILLFRATDRVLFEVEPELELEGDETEVNLEYAQADVVLNDYATLVAGKFLLPFGDFIQQLHPAWINKLASNPLPYLEGEEGGLLPFSDVGLQLRGGARVGAREGVTFDYTVYASNGPRFEDPAIGAVLVSNNTDFNRNKGFGARFALYPLPLDLELGRLKLGASTFNGRWGAGDERWFTSWGVDLAYQLGDLDVRGEYLQTRREFPGAPDDERDGWYLQAAYKLSKAPVDVLRRMELVLRFSGLEQSELSVTPGGEERLRDPRQLAFGIDYWLTPSVAAKLEYDWDSLRNAEDEHAARAQIAVGF